MTAITRMSVKEEQKLKEAVEHVVDLVDSGKEAPNQALKSAAEKYHLLPEQIRVVGRTFNTTRTLDGYKGSSLQEKTATESLADVETVLLEAYPPAQKLAEDMASRFTPAREASSDYAHSPSFHAKQAALQQELVKQASVSRERSRTAEDYAREQRSQSLNSVDGNWDYVRGELSKYAKLARDRVNELELELELKIANVIKSFRPLDAPNVDEVEENYRLVKDASVFYVFDAVREEVPHSEKRARDRHLVTWDPNSLYTKIASIQKTAEELEAAILDDYEVQNLVKQAWAKYLLPMIPERPLNSIAFATETREKQAALLGAPLVMGAGMELGRGVSKLTASPSDLTLVKSDKIGTPDHERNVSAIRTRAMLDGLMNSDPIIKGYSRQEVVHAFNNLSQVAPRASRSPVYAKAMLRKYLEQGGNLDPYDINQIMTADKTIVDRDSKVMDNLRKEEAPGMSAR